VILTQTENEIQDAELADNAGPKLKKFMANY